MESRFGCVGHGETFRVVVDLSRVRDALVVALDAAIHARGRYLAVPHDFYWSVADPLDLDREPLAPEPAIASLVDDYQEGCAILESADEADAAPEHSLEHLGGLLSVLWQSEGVGPATPDDIRASGQG